MMRQHEMRGDRPLRASNKLSITHELTFPEQPVTLSYVTQPRELVCTQNFS